MKLTKRVVKQFEDEQKENGTEAALSNFQVNIAHELLKQVGVKNMHVTYHKGK